MQKYGVDNPRKLQSVVDKARQTNIERYGDISYLKTKAGLEHIQQTNLKKYGADNFMKSDYRFEVLDVMKEKSKQTQIQRYGTSHYSQSDEAINLRPVHKEKEEQTKRANHSFNTSKPEEQLYALLINKFCESDVLRQYKSDVYPFCCDFYIKSINTYIELNVFWTHNTHFFDEANQEDSSKVKEWRSKVNEHPLYAAAIDTWTKRDVIKHKTAVDNNINYVVFWQADLSDAKTWLSEI